MILKKTNSENYRNRGELPKLDKDYLQKVYR